MRGERISFAEAYFIRGSVFHARERVSFTDVNSVFQVVNVFAGRELHQLFENL